MDIAGLTPILILLIIVALTFDFINGMHDAANSIATIVSTRVLSPRLAVIWAAFFNFAAIFFFGTLVAKTVGSGLIRPELIGDRLIFGALAGAISWNLITWWGGLPSSSSHALIGGLVGAGLAASGMDAVKWNGLTKTIVAIPGSPVLGFFLALFLVLIVSWLFVRLTPFAVDSTFRRLQFLSASMFSLGHGGNDAQKTMGVIAALLISHGHGAGKAFAVPLWVMIACYTAMGLGTLTGGWRIVRTMGTKITRLTPMQGFCAETGGAIALFLATHTGIPVSTTHTITGCIVGVGASRRASAVNWGVAGRIFLAWVITLPAAGLVAAAFYWIGGLFLT